MSTERFRLIDDAEGPEVPDAVRKERDAHVHRYGEYPPPMVLTLFPKGDTSAWRSASFSTARFGLVPIYEYRDAGRECIGYELKETQAGDAQRVINHLNAGGSL